MTHLTLLRYTQGPEASAGLLFVNNTFVCYTLEDAFHVDKIQGRTRIPEGTYPITLRKEGGMAPKYNATYESINHDGMLWLRDVPNFEWVYLHVGNEAIHTEGCILVGRQPLYHPDLGYKLYRSGEAYKSLYPKVMPDAARGKASISIQTLLTST